MNRACVLEAYSPRLTYLHVHVVAVVEISSLQSAVADIENLGLVQ